MLKVALFFNIFVMMTLASVEVPLDNPCLEKLFEPTLMKCPLPDFSADRNAFRRYFSCVFKVLRVVNDDGSYRKARTEHEKTLIASARAINSCRSTGSFDIPIDDESELESECIMRQMNLLKLAYKCPNE